MTNFRCVWWATEVMIFSMGTPVSASADELTSVAPAPPAMSSAAAVVMIDFMVDSVTANSNPEASGGGPKDPRGGLALAGRLQNDRGRRGRLASATTANTA